MKITAPAIAAIATAAILTLALALAGCSGGGSTSTSGTNTSAPKENGSSSSKTYTADDLVAILTTANTTLDAKGTIKDNAQLTAALKKLGNGGESITKSLTASGGKITPAACATDLDNAVPNAQKFTAGGGVEASLTYSKGDLGVLTQSGGALPSSITSSLLTDLDGLYGDCSTMKITDGTVSGTLKISKVAATTNADKTYAYSSVISIDGQKITTISVEAVYGNLFIDMGGIGGTLADDVAGINAVVAAAKG